MANTAKTVVEVIELENDKLMVVCVVNKKQLEEIHKVFEPLSRSWLGQYQSLAKGIVDAYNKWVDK